MHVLGARPPDIIREIAKGILNICFLYYILFRFIDMQYLGTAFSDID